MADDNMEISYDGHGDDDIDINIDIEPDNQDEDFIIEDARSEASNNDDVMIDEDTASYEMEDADFEPEHDLQDIDTETIEIAEVEMLRSNDTDAHIFPLEATTNHVLQDESWTFDKSNDTESSIKAVEIEQVHHEEPSNIATEVVAQLPSSPRAAVNSPKPSPSPSDINQQQEETINKENPSDISAETEQGEAAPSATDAPEQETQTEQYLISEDRNVIVVYHESEYNLVSSSEFDDPDLYFLKDPSVMKEPLSTLFAALRDVLSEEISPGDELCLTIDDLGLETSETSASNNDLTFVQIMDLHTTLVRNDGETVMPPLYVTLGTRPEFGKSFSKLVVDARQGKTLYEVIAAWNEDDGLDVWADSEGYEEETSSHIDGTNIGVNEEVENIGGVENDWTEGGSFENASQEPASPKSSTDHKTLADLDAEERVESQVTDVVDQNGSSNEPADSWTDGHEKKTKAETIDYHEADEEGDLIDYEDEDYAQVEDGVPAELKQQNTNHRDQSAENVEINENLNWSRRSSSRTIDGTNGTESSHVEVNVPENANESTEATDDLDLHANQNGGEEPRVDLDEGYENADGDELEHPADNGDDEGRDVLEPTDNGYDEGRDVLEPTDNGDDEGRDVLEPTDNGDGEGRDVLEPTDNGDDEGRDVLEPTDNGDGEGRDVLEPTDNGDDEGSDELEHPVDNGDDEGGARHEDAYDIGNNVDHFQESSRPSNHGEENGQNGHYRQTASPDKQKLESLENVDRDEISYDEDDDAEGSVFALVHSPKNAIESAETGSAEKPKETDEIDYEDDDEETPVEDPEPTTPVRQAATGKRPHEEDEAAFGTAKQEAKRPRS